MLERGPCSIWLGATIHSWPPIYLNVWNVLLHFSCSGNYGIKELPHSASSETKSILLGLEIIDVQLIHWECHASLLGILLEFWTAKINIRWKNSKKIKSDENSTCIYRFTLSFCSLLTIMLMVTSVKFFFCSRGSTLTSLLRSIACTVIEYLFFFSKSSASRTLIIPSALDFIYYSTFTNNAYSHYSIHIYMNYLK